AATHFPPFSRGGGDPHPPPPAVVPLPRHDKTRRLPHVREFPEQGLGRARSGPLHQNMAGRAICLDGEPIQFTHLLGSDQVHVRFSLAKRWKKTKGRSSVKQSGRAEPRRPLAETGTRQEDASAPRCLRTTSATSSPYSRTTRSSSPSTITRTRGSVPEKRTSNRP